MSISLREVVARYDTHFDNNINKYNALPLNTVKYEVVSKLFEFANVLKLNEVNAKNDRILEILGRAATTIYTAESIQIIVEEIDRVFGYEIQNAIRINSRTHGFDWGSTKIPQYVGYRYDTVNDTHTIRDNNPEYDVYEKLLRRTIVNGNNNLNVLSISSTEINNCNYSSQGYNLINAWHKIHSDEQSRNRLKVYKLLAGSISSNIKISEFESRRYEKILACKSIDELRISKTFDIAMLNITRNIDSIDKYDLANLFSMAASRVREDGLIVITATEKFMLHKDLLDLLFNYTSDYALFKDTKEQVQAKRILIVGKKKEKRKTDYVKALEFYVRCIIEIASKEKQEDMLEKTYELPRLNIDDIVFRSKTISEEEVLEILNVKGNIVKTVSHSIIKGIVYGEQQEDKKPLLPPSPGQLGLILVSGKIDGVVDEGNGYQHLIKGSCKKHSSYKTDQVDSTHRQRHETLSNTTEVVMLLPNGTIRRLF